MATAKKFWFKRPSIELWLKHKPSGSCLCLRMIRARETELKNTNSKPNRSPESPIIVWIRIRPVARVPFYLSVKLLSQVQGPLAFLHSPHVYLKSTLSVASIFSIEKNCLAVIHQSKVALYPSPLRQDGLIHCPRSGGALFDTALLRHRVKVTHLLLPRKKY